VTETQTLKLIAAYDRARNEYSIIVHNQTPKEAQSYLDQWSRHLRPECSFIVLDQTMQHRTEDETKCRACRETILRSAHIEPPPKFTRRKP